jgi:MinD superfamily P-loop ATPase
VDASDATAVIVAVTSAIAVLVLIWAIVSMTQTLRLLRQSVDELRRESLPVVAELRATVQQANAELERVDTLLGTAESISSTVDSASRLAYLAFSNPVIKAIAFASGTGRAARRFRKGREAR